MYFRDHGPPYFHAEYGGHKASLRIEDLQVTKGHLPKRAQRMVTEWAEQHRRELEEAWRRAERRQDPGKIAPLD